MPGRPSSEEALKALAPILPLIYPGLEAGALEVREFFGEREQSIDDAALAAHLLRWRAKHYIDKAGPDLDIEFEREPLANSGLSVFHNGYHIRIRKAVEGYDDDGEPVALAPIPGPSAKLQEFYAQQLSLPGMDDQPETTLNLLLLWSVTSDYRLAGLTLACPKAGGITRESVRMYWQVPVPHPALSVERPPQIIDDNLPYQVDKPEEEHGAPDS